MTLKLSDFFSSMDSDSDSDGSHISTTPPRDLKPSPPLPPQPRHHAPPRPPVVSSDKSRARVRPSISSRSKPKPSRCSSSSEPKKPSETDPKPSGDRSPLLSAAALPFQILSRPSDQDRAVSAIETLPAGFFSKSASFSRIRRSSLSFDSVGDGASSQSKSEVGGNDCSAADWLPEELKEDVSTGCGSSARAAKRHSNLIGGAAPLPPVKLRKSGGGGEGNFVKLNMRYSKRKFLNRRGKSNFSSKRNYKRFKKRLRTEGKDETQTENVICEEDGSVIETVHPQKQKQEGMRAKLDSESIEEAILAARNEASDENLARLLRLTHGYDSFREGQLEAIKMVLDGKSSMLVLPTGAGKSLCYQLPAMILPGTTLVISPLVALMIDQLKQLPPVIRGGLFCSSQVIISLFSKRCHL